MAGSKVPPQVISRSWASGAGPYTAPVGKPGLRVGAHAGHPEHRQRAVGPPDEDPLPLVQSAAAGRTRRDPASESMCPAMTAPPGSPGRGLPVYQPATRGAARHLQRPGRGQAEVDQPGPHADGRDDQPDRPGHGPHRGRRDRGPLARRDRRERCGLPTGVAAPAGLARDRQPGHAHPGQDQADQQCHDRGGPAYHPDGRDMPAAGPVPRATASGSGAGRRAARPHAPEAPTSARVQRGPPAAAHQQPAADRGQQAGAAAASHGSSGAPGRGAVPPNPVCAAPAGIDLAALRVHQVVDAQLWWRCPARRGCGCCPR